MNIGKKIFPALTAALLLPPLTLTAELLFDADTEKALTPVGCAELTRMERQVTSAFLSRRERRARAAKMISSGAVPPGEIQLVLSGSKADLQWDPRSVEVLTELPARRRLYSAFLLVHLERGPCRTPVPAFLPEWITDALDLQLRLARQTQLLKGNCDLPVLRAYAEWGTLPDLRVLIPPAGARGGRAERRCRAELGFLLLNALRHEPEILKRYLLACRQGKSDPADRFEKLILRPLKQPFEPRKNGDPPADAQLEKALLSLAGQLAWSPVGTRPAANVLVQLTQDLAEVTLIREGQSRQRCPLRSLPGLLPTVPEERQPVILQEVDRTLHHALRGADRPLREKGAAFRRTLFALPLKRTEGDNERFRESEKAFLDAYEALLAQARREAAIEEFLDRVTAERCALPFRADGCLAEFRLGEPLDRSTEQLLEQTERHYLSKDD